ncbi:MAG: amino acid aminotransferase [Pseudomonadota bacterium]
MLTDLKPQAPDKILALMAAFKADPRPGKLDLGVGVYRNAAGITPVMRAVKAAEAKLVETQETKVYTGLAGDPAFARAVSDLILGPALAADRRACVATPGGTGAVRQGLELVRMARPDATVWLSDPTWPNHPAIIDHVGLSRRAYRYFDASTGGVDIDGMRADLGRVQPGDVVVLHGCCHNPTGADLTEAQWKEVAALLNASGAVPFVDLAYLGFGDSLEEDARGTRILAETCPEMLIAASCSKNFGIYRERTGLLLSLAATPTAVAVTQGAMDALNRLNYSFPPDHGARVVQMILDDDGLRADWMAELSEMRTNMSGLRQQLANALRERTGSDRFGFLAAHRGMFSRLGATPEQVEAMRRDHGVYMVGDSRMNIAGLTSESVPLLADAIVAAGV